MVLVVIVWIISMAVAVIVGSHKDKALPALVTSFFLGPVGLVAVCFWRDGRDDHAPG